MGNKVLVLVCLVICFSIVSCEREESDGLILDAVDVKKQAPLIFTYQESVTGGKLNIPFHYSLKEKSERGAPSFIKHKKELKAYSVNSFFEFGSVGSIYIFKSDDANITVDDIFDNGKDISFIFGDNNNYIIEYQDKNIIVYRQEGVVGMLYTLYYDFVESKGLHVVYTSSKADAKHPTIENAVVILEANEDDDLIYPIVDDLRLLKGLISTNNNIESYIFRWSQYKKELPWHALNLYEDAVIKLTKESASLDIGNSKSLEHSKGMPSLTLVAVSSSDTNLRVFNKDLTDKELWHYLKRIDDEAISYYEKRSYEIDTVYKDDTNLLVKFTYTYNPSKHVYFSASKLLLDDKSVIISAQSETEPMARFYLSYFDHIQEVVSSSKPS